MSFISIEFLLFVAVVILLYFAVPDRFQWIVLLIGSYVFYWLCSGWLILVLLGTSFVTYLTGKMIYRISSEGKQYIKEHSDSLTKEERKNIKESTKKKTKHVLIAGVFIDLGLLILLKYSDFFITTANKALEVGNVSLPTFNFLLPLGVSFYTLQAVAYMTDIYRNKYMPDDNFAKFMLYMSYFPQIVQGPIARHNHLAHQLYDPHEFDYNRAMHGVQLMLWGWMKKMIIADWIAIPANCIFDNYLEYKGLIVFLGAVFYGIQVYADFSGGMDIARGVSQILGIELELNFKQPYFSTSIEDFWRRWHITLGAWMRNYIFYPLSLSKLFGKLSKKARNLLGQSIGKKLPAFLAMFIVYFLVGIWHGPNWTYIAYGIWNGVFIVSGILLDETYGKAKRVLKIDENTFTWKLFQIGRTFIIVSLGRFFSRAETLGDALSMFRLSFEKCYDLSFVVDGRLLQLGLTTSQWIVLAVALIVLFFVDYLHEQDINIRETISKQHIVFRWTIYYGALILLLVFGMYGPGFDSAAFVYQQF